MIEKRNRGDWHTDGYPGDLKELAVPMMAKTMEPELMRRCIEQEAFSCVS